MQIIAQYIVSYEGNWQLLSKSKDGNYYITSNGGFGQRDMCIESITAGEAEKLIDPEDLLLPQEPH